MSCLNKELREFETCSVWEPKATLFVTGAALVNNWSTMRMRFSGGTPDRRRRIFLTKLRVLQLTTYGLSRRMPHELLVRAYLLTPAEGDVFHGETTT